MSKIIRSVYGVSKIKAKMFAGPVFSDHAVEQKHRRAQTSVKANLVQSSTGTFCLKIYL